MGHIHLMLPDISEARRAFLALGGACVRDLGPFEIIPFPGAYVLLSKAESSGGSADSLVSSISFRVQSLPATVDMCRAAGLKIEKFASHSRIRIPGDVIVELMELPSATNPIQFHAINFSSDDGDAMASWYGRLFGAEPSQDLETITIKIPGADLRIKKKDYPGLPTKGRSLDHIGFEVIELGEIYEKWTAAGVEFESAPRLAPNGVTKVVFCKDPWGTRIELTEKITALL